MVVSCCPACLSSLRDAFQYRYNYDIGEGEQLDQFSCNNSWCRLNEEDVDIRYIVYDETKYELLSSCERDFWLTWNWIQVRR